MDAFTTCGRGQRLGIFAGSGVGKSSLLGMISRHSSADINVIALIGERGREVLEFVEKDLGPEALKRSVIIVATSDQPALVRIKAAFTANTIAAHFRDQGKHVLLMMDSLTRLAMAQREVGLAVGEPPATRGYPPSVFGLLPVVLEQAGCNEHGAITGFYTVLTEGDDWNDPVSDCVRSILDGHILLSRKLASENQYPGGRGARKPQPPADRSHHARTPEDRRRRAARAGHSSPVPRAARHRRLQDRHQSRSSTARSKFIPRLMEFLRQPMAEKTTAGQDLRGPPFAPDPTHEIITMKKQSLDIFYRYRKHLLEKEQIALAGQDRRGKPAEGPAAAIAGPRPGDARGQGSTRRRSRKSARSMRRPPTCTDA